MKKLPPIVFLLTFLLVIFAVINPSAGTDYLLDNHYNTITENESLPTNTNPQNDNQVSTEKPDSNNNQPSSNYRIDACIGEQKVRIYENGKVIKEWTVSTGMNNSTPQGTFTIQNRGEWFFSEKYQQGAVWWVSFKDWGVYLFHSVPMDRDRNVLEEEASKLGSPSSHGCIRLEIDDAKWIYDNIPAGTPVNIYE